MSGVFPMTRHTPLALLFAVAVTSLPAAEIVPIPTGDLSNPRQPQAAVDDAGTIYVAYGADGKIYCSVSRDKGKSFSPPVEVAGMKRLALGARRGPRVAVTEKAVFISAIGGEQGGGRDGDLFVWRSEDGGKTFQGPVQVNDVNASAREGLHAMAAGPDGRAACVWLDLRNDRTELVASYSNDHGKTWSRNQLVYRSPSGSICECCHPSVAYDAQGGLYFMWRNSLGGFRDLYAVVSRNGGKSYTRAVKLGRGSWKLDACPMDGGAIAVIGPGKVVSVWRREKQIFRTGTGAAEERLGPGEQPWAAGTPDGAYLAWVSKRPGDLWLLRPDAKAPQKLASSANDPALAAPLGKSGPVVAVWESGNRRNTKIHAAVVSDD